jgi:oxygen-independent coproporphyrinogen-3 oxidase
VIKSLFRSVGLDQAAYRAAFGDEVFSDFPELVPLVAAGLFVETDDQLLPTAAGLERSDALGPMLFSERVKASMAEFDLR